MSKRYFINDGKAQRGPVTLDQIAAGSLKATDKVWAEGMDDWVEAKNFEELKSILLIQPPPIQTSALSVNAKSTFARLIVRVCIAIAVSGACLGITYLITEYLWVRPTLEEWRTSLHAHDGGTSEYWARDKMHEASSWQEQLLWLSFLIPSALILFLKPAINSVRWVRRHAKT